MTRKCLGVSLSLVAIACGGGDPAGSPDGGEADTGPDVIDVDAPADASGDATADAAAACSAPESPYGTRVGAILEPFTLETCDGDDYSFYNEEFCDATLTVVSIAAGWCPPCIRESMELTETITEPYGELGVRVIQVLTQDESYSEPTRSFCSAWVNTYDLTNVELIDPTQLTAIYFPGNSLPATIIVDRNGMIRFRENGATEGLVTLRSALDELLEEVEAQE